eukprot:CAMPEP_0172599648 /NCGR_PEP_ID=MMETSP1068-20121228/19760_1 /TAXON_ID=35684 /ORGANISM="Pseudopedinella elastica, Strain CCMP716" /LENGTH=51 /DNA_ID=CAMNT_0013399963 /DNA_START=160 /DNA_END=312 /DNA_ORIENTATION=-
MATSFEDVKKRLGGVNSSGFRKQPTAASEDEGKAMSFWPRHISAEPLEAQA